MMKNGMAIHDAHNDAARKEYKSHCKNVYSSETTHNEWAKSSVEEFATAHQVWMGEKSDFFCTHFLTGSKNDVFKQIALWDMSRFFATMVIETDRFTSALMPPDRRIDQSYFND
jgi:hypothetical protein